MCICCGWCEALWLCWETCWECVGALCGCLLTPIKCLLAIPICLCCCVPCLWCRGKAGFMCLVQSLWGAGLSGIVQGHGYSVLDVAEVPTSWGSYSRIVKLRNPWGQTEWTGLFSDGSCAWTEEAKEEVAKEDDRDDGVFWMHLSDFMSYLSNVAVCYVGPGKYRTPDKRQEGDLDQNQVGLLCGDGDEYSNHSDDDLEDGYNGMADACGRFGSSAWRVRSYALKVPEGVMEAGVMLVVPTRAQAFLTVNDPENVEHDGMRGFLSGHWAVLVYDMDKELVAKNLAPPRALALGCCDAISGLDRQFSNLVSLSTTQMLIEPGYYVVEVAFPQPTDAAQDVHLIVHSTCDISLAPVPEDFLPETGS